MRSLAAALLLAGCATAAAPTERLHGCWIERTPSGATATMRWFPDSARPEMLVGDYLFYAQAEPVSRRYTLSPAEGGNDRFCSVPASGEERCWTVARGSAGSLEGGRAFIDFHRERLRIAVHDGAVERVIFQGVRDGCD